MVKHISIHNTITYRQNCIHIIQQGIQIFHCPIPLLVSDYKLPPGTAAGEHPPPLLRVNLEGGHRSESFSNCGPLGSHTLGPGNRVVENIIEVSIANCNNLHINGSASTTPSTSTSTSSFCTSSSISYHNPFNRFFNSRAIIKGLM